ncbi:indole-3-glycerol phosphate synthase [Clostridium polyendosporum]|uniref:Indole-3-glycerol phosphate synthase n=1 Tax=Clostridium polyendosporum TaxID=69208 RepID=A0A919S1N6_9CLOT|nr:indole-3-glycerol phosphate synthase TrpC [Clostridium polyendosporum]GIM29809.1 indole-3-glycerol phosphate synthase [Clostridium polyendosporum]
MILDTIFEERRKQLEREKESCSLSTIMSKLKDVDREGNLFLKTLKNTKELFIIGEIKKASPSKGDIAPNIDVEKIARQYHEAQVQAISVLTEERYFKGSSQNIVKARLQTDKPILRKDFIFDPYQIYEAKTIGADCVLLIVAMLNPKELKDLISVAQSIQIDTLVEVHDEEEAKIAQEVGAKIIGINNRNLKDFTVDIRNTEKVMKVIEKDNYIISESGIHTREHIRYIESIGANGALIGESLMIAENIPTKVKELRGYDRG